MNKVKEFFANTKVKVAELVVLALTSAGLIFGGVTETEISNTVALVGGSIVAIGALAAFISSLVKKGE